MGTHSEYLAASYYLGQGFPVYWPACQQGPVDFIVERPNGRLDRVQVKTAGWNGKYLQCRTRLAGSFKDCLPGDLYDYLFVVSERGSWEIPASEITTSNLGLDNRTGDYIPKGRDWSEYKIKENE